MERVEIRSATPSRRGDPERAGRDCVDAVARRLRVPRVPVARRGAAEKRLRESSLDRPQASETTTGPLMRRAPLLRRTPDAGLRTSGGPRDCGDPTC